VFGLYPRPVLDISAVSVAQLIDNFNHAVGSVHSAALAR
jgi:NADH-quinone oxidoreductase subunit M